VDTNSPSAADTLAFWQAEAAGYEERARAEGHQVQSCLALAVTVVAGGLLAAGFEVLAAPIVATVVAFSLWLLALVCALHWAEMIALAAKRTASEDRVEMLLGQPDAAVFRRLQDHRSFGRFWWFASAAAILICVFVFGAVFVYCLFQATPALQGMQVIFVVASTMIAASTIAVAAAGGIVRARAVSAPKRGTTDAAMTDA
jgi:hypothetical protein